MINALLVPLAVALQATAAPSPLYDPAQRIGAQREAMKALSFLDGAWRGPATANGYALTQTERVGSFLDGTVKVIEGRGYDADGTVRFNALGVISYDPVKRAYTMRSYAMGYSGDHAIAVRPNGFSWETQAGPGVVMRYNTATVENGTWRETGERVVAGAAPVRMVDMRLSKVGPSDWPGAGAVAPR